MTEYVVEFCESLNNCIFNNQRYFSCFRYHCKTLTWSCQPKKSSNQNCLRDITVGMCVFFFYFRFSLNTYLNHYEKKKSSHISLSKCPQIIKISPETVEGKVVRSFSKFNHVFRRFLKGVCLAPPARGAPSSPPPPERFTQGRQCSVAENGPRVTPARRAVLSHSLRVIMSR